MILRVRQYLGGGGVWRGRQKSLPDFPGIFSIIFAEPLHSDLGSDTT